MGSENLSFRLTRSLGGGIERAFHDEKAKLQRLLPRAEILHTGGTSIPDALTRGDLDIHVRVLAHDFSDARKTLISAYVMYCPEMWTAEFATFVEPNAPVATGIALTAVGGEHDQRFVVGWDRLNHEPLLLKQYNALKLKYEGALDANAYQSAKSAFFSALVSLDGEWPDPLA